MEDDLWDELGDRIGKRERSELFRRFAAAFLKRPGAKIPRLKDYEPPG